MNDNVTKNTSTSTSVQTLVCKLGLDCHAGSITVARQLDGQNPQPPQKFSPKKFLSWVEEQIQKGYRVSSCYEAGPTGYWLHRKLQELGATNYVVCPTKLDSRSRGVNTDKTDALELVVRLDRYVAGNHRSFSLVKVPTAAQEQKRALSRQRDQLRKKRHSLATQGRMLLLNQGYRYGNRWWQPKLWEKLQTEVPAWILDQLESFRCVIQCITREVAKHTVRVAQAAPPQLPAGLGALSHEVMEREVKDWKNFSNRRQIGSYSGLTGGVSASGERSADLSVTKAGNRRLGVCLIECSWRLLRYQPDYWLVKKWQPVLLNPHAHARGRKKAIVAFARQLIVDIWKWKTGRTTPEALGWKMA